MSKILVIDDDVTIQVILKYALSKEGHEVILASNGLDGVLQAKALHPDVVICDWMMPLMNGLEVCQKIKSDPELAFTYFILLTIREDVSDRIQGLDMGADEYLAKPIDIAELQARVRAGLRLQGLAKALKESNAILSQTNQQLLAQNELLESLSLTDPLTGLLNRRALDQALPHLLKQVGSRSESARYRYLCLLMIDVDYFKQINDRYGHAVGDCILQAVTGRLQSKIRSGSFLYRYGGEEFVCVTPGLNPEFAWEYSQSLCTAIGDQPIKVSEADLVPTTISIGGTIASEINSVQSLQLLQQADEALYQAKQAGRNCVRFSQQPI